MSTDNIQLKPVWILSRGEAHEGSEIEDVFEDRDDALEEAQRLMSMSRRKGWSKIGSVDDMTWRSGCDVMTLTSWTPKPKKTK